MLRNYELNCPATPVSIAVSTVSPVVDAVSTVPPVATGFSFHLDGMVVGPVGEAQTYDLTGINIATGFVGFIALYLRPVFDVTAGTTTFVKEVQLTDTQAINKVGAVFNQDYSKGFAAATTKSSPTQNLFVAGKAYLAGDLIRQGMEVYKSKANFTAGATFNSDNWTLVTTPDATPRALLGLITVANETGSAFVGGTTALNAANVTTTVFTELAFSNQ